MYFRLLLMIIISYIVLDIHRFMKKVNERNIRQVDFIDDNTFDSLLRKQNPVIILKAIEQLPDLFLDVPINVLDYASNIHSMLSFSHKKYNISFFKNRTFRTCYDRTFYVQLSKDSYLHLYPPSQSTSMYLNQKQENFYVGPTKKNISEQAKRYPLINKAKYINIKCKEGSILYIPRSWSFSIPDSTTSAMIIGSHTIASKILCFV